MDITKVQREIGKTTGISPGKVRKLFDRAKHPQTPVPADRYPYRDNKIFLLYRYRDHGKLSAGTPPLQVLENSGEVLKKWDYLYPILVTLTGSPGRAEMVKKALRLEATTGRCFASAKYLKRSLPKSYGDPWGGEHPEDYDWTKTWDRCIARLRKLGLAKTQRLDRPTDQGLEQATNLTDLRTLWALLYRLIQSASALVEQVGSIVWVRVSGAWVTVTDLLARCLSPPPTEPQQQGAFL